MPCAAADLVILTDRHCRSAEAVTIRHRSRSLLVMKGLVQVHLVWTLLFAGYTAGAC